MDSGFGRRGGLPAKPPKKRRYRQPRAYPFWVGRLPQPATPAHQPARGLCGAAQGQCPHPNRRRLCRGCARAATPAQCRNAIPCSDYKEAPAILTRQATPLVALLTLVLLLMAPLALACGPAASPTPGDAPCTQDNTPPVAAEPTATATLLLAGRRAPWQFRRRVCSWGQPGLLRLGMERYPATPEPPPGWFGLPDICKWVRASARQRFVSSGFGYKKGPTRVSNRMV